MSEKKPVTITLDRERRLEYSVNSLADIQDDDKLGKSFAEINIKGAGLKELRALLWAGLVHEDPTLTIRDAGNLLTPKNLVAVGKAIGKALTDFFGTSK